MDISSLLPEKKDVGKAQISQVTQQSPGKSLLPTSPSVNLFIHTMTKNACKILVESDLLRESLDHDEQAQFYNSTRACFLPEEEHSNDPNPDAARSTIYLNYVLPHATEDWVVFLSTSGKYDVMFSVDLRGVVDSIESGYSDRVSWSEFFPAYLYFVYTSSAFRQEQTGFIHIDDPTLLDRALHEVTELLESGRNIWSEFAAWEIAYYRGAYHMPGVHYWNGKVLKQEDGSWSKSDCLDDYCSNMAIPPVDFRLSTYRFYKLFAFLVLTQDVVTLDVESTGLDIFQDTIVSCGLSFDAHVGFYLSVDHRKPKKRVISIQDKGVMRQAAENAVMLKGKNVVDCPGAPLYMQKLGDSEINLGKEYFKTFLDDRIRSKKRIIYHNAKYDYNIIKTQLGVILPISFDTMMAHYIARPGYDDPNRDKRGLKVIANKELGVPSWKVDLTKVQYEQKDLAGAYNARDICYTHALSLLLLPVVNTYGKLFWDVEMPFVKVLAHAEYVGIGLDAELLKDVDTRLRRRMFEIEEIFKSKAEDPEFNLGSSQQLSKLFFEKLNIKPIRRCKKCIKMNMGDSEECPYCGGEAPRRHVTPAGIPSLNKYALEDWDKAGVEEASLVIEHRGLQKLTSSYTNLAEKAHPYDGNIHPSYHQARTATGRLSCSNPNFQQLPKRSAKYIRDAIIPPVGKCLISADYSGQENIIMAAYSRDDKFIAAYNPCFFCDKNTDPARKCQFGKCKYEDQKDPESICKVQDLHSYITKKIYADIVTCPISEINGHPEFGKIRTKVKSITFALAYGGGAYGIADKNGISIQEAEALVEDYFNTFPGIRTYIQESQRFVDQYGYIPDMFHRVRRFKYAGYALKEHEGNYDGEKLDWRDPLMRKPTWGKNGQYVTKDRRAGTNHPIQAVAASMTKIGGNNLYRMLLERPYLQTDIVEFIHDEILLTVPKDPAIIREVLDLIQRAMVDDLDLQSYCMPNHPLKWSWPEYLRMFVGIDIGDSYGSLMDPEEYINSIS